MDLLFSFSYCLEISSIFVILTLELHSEQLKITHRQSRASILVDICVSVFETGEKKIWKAGSAEQVRLRSRIFIMSCQSFLSAQQLSSALIPPNLPHSSLLSLFHDTLLRRPVSFITSGGIEFLQLSI